MQLRVAQINLHSNLSFSPLKAQLQPCAQPLGSQLCAHIHPLPISLPVSTPSLTPLSAQLGGGGQGCCTPSAQHPNVAPTELYCALSRWGAQQTLSTALSPWLNTFYLHFLLYCSLFLALSSDCTPTRSGAAPCGCSLPYTQRMHDPI